MPSDLFTTINNFIGQYFAFFPVASLCIFLVFAAMKMWNCRVAWFLSLSAPGIIVLPIAILQILVRPPYRPSAFGALFFAMVIFPAWWIFPTVFAVQLRNLLKRRWNAMTPYSYVGAAILLSLYFWTDFVAKALNRL